MKIRMDLENTVVSGESHSWNRQQFVSFWRKTIGTGLQDRIINIADKQIYTPEET
jgi:hypothetical protein